MRAVVHILFLGFISIEVLLATRSHETIAGVGGKVFVLDEVGFFFASSSCHGLGLDFGFVVVMEKWIHARTSTLQSLYEVLTLRAHIIACANHLTHPLQITKRDQF